MKKFLFFLMTLITITVMSSCHNDVENEETIIESPPFVPTIVEEVTGNLQGYVYDEAGQPVSDVRITVYSATTFTNQYGIFELNNIRLDGNGTYVKAQKDGYILGSDMVYADATTNHSRIQMISLTNEGNLDARQGGKITVRGGGEIDFPGGGFVTSTGSAYNGSVIVTARRIATDEPTLGDIMPGGLNGKDASGNDVVLGTLGMIAVELRSPTGAEVNLAPETKAQVTFPIATDLQETAPDNIPLWSFDEDRGLWVEEGQAEKVGSNYVGEVSHFSFWNCDAPFPLVKVCGRVLDQNGNPIPQAQVTVKAENLGCGMGWTNELGVYCGKMPKNKLLKISVRVPGCNETIMITAGPFSSNADVDDIIINLGQATFAGQVKCDNDPAPGSKVVIKVGFNTYIVTTDESGNFIWSAATGCASENNYNLFAYDPATGEGSETLNFSNSQDGIVLNVCSGCNFDLTLTFDNDPCNPWVGTATATATGGSGNYEYVWNHSPNGNGATVDIEGQRLYCVTVTDLGQDCQKVICEDYVLPNDSLGFYILLDTNPATCGLDNGSIEIQVIGGLPPYTYVWSNGQNTPNLDNLSSGAYWVSVTDANGCEAQNEIFLQEISDLRVEIDPYFDFDCGSQTSSVQAIVSGGSAPYTYTWASEGGIPNGDILTMVPSLTTVCVTVTDSDGCAGEDCIEILGFDPEIFNIYQGGCFDSLDSHHILMQFGGEVFYRILDLNGNLVGENFNSLQNFYAVNVLEYGFSYIVELIDPIFSCNDDLAFTFINFDNSLTVSESGGVISASFNNPNCTGCTSPMLYVADDINNPLDINEVQPPGEYVVIVRNSFGGSDCIVAFEYITIN